jgi:cytochrome c oxidase subunit 1
MLYAFGFIGLFTLGAASGLFLATPGMNVHLAGSCFEAGHFHYIIAGAGLMALLGGLHYWWPKITGRLYPEGWGRLSSLAIFLGANLAYFPQLLLGYLGLPRHYHEYPEEFQLLSVASSAGALLLAAGCLLTLVCLAWSMRYGRPAGPNPWGAEGLEWLLSSPPPGES